MLAAAAATSRFDRGVLIKTYSQVGVQWARLFVGPPDEPSLGTSSPTGNVAAEGPANPTGCMPTGPKAVWYERRGGAWPANGAAHKSRCDLRQKWRYGYKDLRSI